MKLEFDLGKFVLSFVEPFDKPFVVNLLKEVIAEVTFIKRDGSERLLKCTLCPSSLPMLPKLLAPDALTEQTSETIAVWDLEKNDWRSFRLDSIIKIAFTKNDAQHTFERTPE